MSGEVRLVSTSVLPTEPAPHSQAASRLRNVWPVACLGIAGIATAIWVGFLGYGFFKLVERLFLVAGCQ